MCGLAGYIGSPLQDDKYLLGVWEGLAVRGTDGYGYMAYDKKKGMDIWKDNTNIKGLKVRDEFDFKGSEVVMLHTRWASSGGKVVESCHPLQVDHIVVAHNGIISYHEKMRHDLQVPGGAPQVDSYLIPWIISQENSIVEGIKRVYRELTGSLTFLTYSTRSPQTLWISSNCANIFHFKMMGGDYLCSTEDIFRQGIAQYGDTTKYVPGYKSSYGLDGIWELTPKTFKQIMKFEYTARKEDYSSYYMGANWRNDEWTDEWRERLRRQKEDQKAVSFADLGNKQKWERVDIRGPDGKITRVEWTKKGEEKKSLIQIEDVKDPALKEILETLPGMDKTNPDASRLSQAAKDSVDFFKGSTKGKCEICRKKKEVTQYEGVRLCWEHYREFRLQNEHVVPLQYH